MIKLYPGRTMLCSTLAIATALLAGASPAAAQALLGNVTSSTGVGPITTAPGSTVIPVTSQQAVINWSATGPSSGGVTTFSNPGSLTSFTGTSNFAILNRVAPNVAADSILMGGDIRSSVNGQVGGTVYFYSPNGIVIGSNATINVGSLGLTTLPVADAQGVWMSGFGTATPQVAFGAATNAASFVRSQAGGTIAANGPGNYVALVAPRIEHRGTIRTDGGAALVAASAATITFNPTGLYDIVVTTGSSDANGVVVNGGRIERNNATVGGDHKAYLVSVPANNAMTMLVQGGASLGFDIAGSAGVEGNVVVLSAGRNVFGGATVGPPAPPASATIDYATIGSKLVLDTSQRAQISSGAGVTILSGDVSILATNGITVAAENHRLAIGGSLVAVADNIDNEGRGGAINISVKNSQTLAIGGDVVLSANGYGYGAADDGLNAGDGTGGRISVQALGGGTLAIAGKLDAQANGFGGLHIYTNGASGSGTGGTITIDSGGGNSALRVGGLSTLQANGNAGPLAACTTCSIRGGTGIGGTINVIGGVRSAGSGANRIDFDGGLIMAANGVGGAGDAAAGSGRGGTIRMATRDGTIVNSRGGLRIAVDGLGGAYLGSGSAKGGDGTGGEALIGADDSAGGTFDVSGGIGEIKLSAQGIGGNAISGIGAGGIGQGGRLSIDAKGATITLGGNVELNATGVGGSATGGSGGRGTGGAAFAQAYGRDLRLGGNLDLRVSGAGGNGRGGGAAQGGTASVVAETGSRLGVAGVTRLDASAEGGLGTGANGGAGTGGMVQVQVRDGGTLTLQSALLANAMGGGGGALATAGRAGDGLGGSVGLGAYGTNATLDARGDALLLVDGRGGSRQGGGAGGDGSGGQIVAQTSGGNGNRVLIGGNLRLSANGVGSDGYGGAGGNGKGGGAHLLLADDGRFAVGGALTIGTRGDGGDQSNGGQAGSGIGGDAEIGLAGAATSLLTVGTNAGTQVDRSTALDSSGYGGSAGGIGGTGTGGWSRISGTGGSANFFGEVTLQAEGEGGNGENGAGGAGIGGRARLNADGAAYHLYAGLSLATNAIGGSGRDGGGATLRDVAGESNSEIFANRGGSILVDGASNIGSSATGGTGLAGGAGGTAVAGRLQLIAGDATTGRGTIALGALTAAANAIGGAGGAGLSSLVGGSGGAATGGQVSIIANSNASGASMIATGNSMMSAMAGGGNGGIGGNGAAGGAGGVGRGGTIDALAIGGSAKFNMLALSADVSGKGGSGGLGGSAGGRGGEGASGRGGVIRLGVSESTTAPVAGAGAVFGNVVAAANSTGGAGASGGIGGAGGHGGMAGASRIEVIAVGGSLTTGDLIATAASSGGNGGSGSTPGNGGDAFTSNFWISASDAANDPARGAAATLGNVTATVAANGGSGSVTGRGISLGGAIVDVRNSRLNLGSYAATLSGAGAIDPAALGDRIRLINATVTTDRGFSLATDKTLSVYSDRSAFRAGSLALSAADFVDEAAFGVPATLGTISAGSIGVLSKRNILLDAHLASVASLTLNAAGLVQVGDLSASGAAGGSDIAVTAGTTVTTGSIKASRAVDVVAGGYVSLGEVIGTPIRIRSNTASVNADDLTAIGSFVQINAKIDISVDNLAANSIAIAAGRDIGTVNLTAALLGIDASAGGTLTSAVLSARTDVRLDAVGAITTGAIGSQNGGIGVVGKNAITTGNLVAGGGVVFDAGGAISTGTIGAQSADLLAIGDIGAGTITTSRWAGLKTQGTLSAATISAGEHIDLAARGALVAGNLSAGMADAAIRAGATYGISISSGTSVAVGTARARDSITIGSSGALTAATLDARNGVRLDAAGALATGAISSVNGAIQAVGKTSITTGNLSAGGGVLLDTRGAIATGTISALWADLFANGAINVGTVTTGQWVDIESEASLTTGNVTAGEGIDLAARGALVAGDLSAGLVNANVRAGANYNVGILSGTSVALGNVGARDWIGIGTTGALTAGTLASRNDVLLASDGALQTGAITTGAQNRLLIAGSAMTALGGPLATFNRNFVFAALGTSAQASARGPVTIGGAISSGRIDALVAGDFVAGALTATNAAFVTVGGTVTINGAWASPLTRIASNDLTIGTSGKISGGRIDLISTNATQLLVGDGLTGSGYLLDNAEYGRLSGASVNIIGRSDASAAIDALIGNLTLSGRTGGSEVTIATVVNGTVQPGGVLRVVGAVNGTGYSANDAFNLAAGRVEVDTNTGSISLLGSGGALGGVLTLAGQRVHIAETAVLDKLAIDANYANRDIDLARAPKVQRPDGVVRAGEIYVELVNGAGQSGPVGTAAPYSVLVQNVGTSTAPAGFSGRYAEIVSPAGAAPGAIDIIVHGQLVTAEGTLIGVAVRDALTEDDDTARFTGSSLINGCALTGPCVLRQALPIEPQPDISTVIQLIGAPTGGDALFGNEEAIEDNEEEGGEDSASSPIAPPVPLFNTKPLEQKGETDEPVSGGGNPALIGSGPVEGEK